MIKKLLKQKNARQSNIAEKTPEMIKIIEAKKCKMIDNLLK